MYLNRITVFSSAANPIKCVFKPQQMLFQTHYQNKKCSLCSFLADLLDPPQEAHIRLQTKLSPDR